jgi:hypothetical protein
MAKKKTAVMNDPHALAAWLEKIDLQVSGVQEEEIYALCPDEECRGHWKRNSQNFSLNVRTKRGSCSLCGHHTDLVCLVRDLTARSHWEAIGLLESYGVAFTDIPTSQAFDKGEVIEVREITFEEDDLNEVRADLRLRRHIHPEYLQRWKLTQEACLDYEVEEYDAFPSLALPIKDVAGVLKAWQIEPNHTLSPWVVPDAVPRSRFLFGLDRLKDTEVVLTEHPLDAVRLHSLGYRFSAVSSFTSYVSDQQLALLEGGTDIESLIIALDDDEAGHRGIQSFLERSLQRPIPIYLFDYADGEGKALSELTAEQIDRGLAQARPALAPEKVGRR